MKDSYLHIEGKNLSATIRWVPAHLVDNVSDNNLILPPGVTMLDVSGIKQADTLAKAGAHSNSPDLKSATRVVFYASLARRIQNRLATIVCNLPNRPHRVQAPRQPKLKSMSLCICRLIIGLRSQIECFACA